MASYFITGGTRGIGLGIATALMSKPSSEVAKVFATGRKSNPNLDKLIQESSGRVEFVSVEVTNQESVKSAVATIEKSLGDKGLDVLINSAGILNVTPEGVDKITDLESTFAVNVVGTQNVTTAFLPLLRKGTQKKVFNVTSTMASNGMSSYFKMQPAPAYKVSKAAVNMLTTQYAEAFADEGFTFIAICPGCTDRNQWVKTDLGSQAADLTVEQSANGIVEQSEKITAKDSGKFLSIKVEGWEERGYHGGERPF
ncbi:short chain oxidoreductase [Elsinoe ampelina]|uniref:Short chain oxidoreductase n=1 Tax=Elsinoe ampelina TaxID=302913 RepID=A0A6A6GAP7_9PEZI|nr:short chain oxidoreductase [Elsinoe ampelina]